jgi:hypothetical protein
MQKYTKSISRAKYCDDTDCGAVVKVDRGDRHLSALPASGTEKSVIG